MFCYVLFDNFLLDLYSFCFCLSTFIENVWVYMWSSSWPSQAVKVWMPKKTCMIRGSLTFTYYNILFIILFILSYYLFVNYCFCNKSSRFFKGQANFQYHICNALIIVISGGSRVLFQGVRKERQSREYKWNSGFGGRSEPQKPMPSELFSA